MHEITEIIFETICVNFTILDCSSPLLAFVYNYCFSDVESIFSVMFWDYVADAIFRLNVFHWIMLFHKKIVYHQLNLIRLSIDYQASIHWFLVEGPTLKLLTPAISSSPNFLKYHWIPATTTFSEALPALIRPGANCKSTIQLTK